MGHGNILNGNGTRLVWWLMGLFAVLATSSYLFFGSALYAMNGRMSALEAKMDLLIAERRYRVEPPR